MARINIEDELESDFRFKRLVRLVGDEDKAIGLIYRFWRIAQKLWGDEMSLILEEEFHAEGFAPILSAGLAEVRDNGVYAKGSEDRFAWYLQKCRASKIAASVRTEKKSRSIGTKSRSTGNESRCTGDESRSIETDSRSTETCAPVNPLAPALAPAPVPALAPALAPALSKIHKEENVSDKKNQGTEPSQIPDGHLETAIEQWEKTLLWANAGREILEQEKIQIFRMLKSDIPLVDLCHAFSGMRFEAEIPGVYDPKKNIDIFRVWDVKKRTKLITLSTQEAQRRSKLISERRQKIEKVKEDPPEESGSSFSIKAINVMSFLKSMPKDPA
jgi:hypothetical protein